MTYIHAEQCMLLFRLSFGSTYLTFGFVCFLFSVFEWMIWQSLSLTYWLSSGWLCSTGLVVFKCSSDCCKILTKSYYTNLYLDMMIRLYIFIVVIILGSRSIKISFCQSIILYVFNHLYGEFDLLWYNLPWVFFSTCDSKYFTTENH